MRKMLTVLCVLAVLLLVTVRAEAALSVEVRAAGSLEGMWSVSQDETDYQTVGRAINTASIEYNGVNANAVAWAEYGRLGISGQTSGAVYSPLYGMWYPNASANSIASFSDSWTISNPLLNGSTGSIYFHATLEGEISGTNSSVLVSLFDATGTMGGSHNISSLLGSETFTLGRIDFTFGTPFEITMRLAGLIDQNGLIDLDNTAWLSGIEVRSGTNQITDYQLTAASGQSYPIVTPVPPAVLLLGSGLIGLIGIRRFRK